MFVRLKGVFKGYVLEMNGELYYRIVHPQHTDITWFVLDYPRLKTVADEMAMRLEKELNVLLEAGAEDLCQNGSG